MRDFLLGLRIRIKLLAAFGSILLLSVLLIILSVRSIDRIIYYKAINEDVDLLKLRLDALDLAYKEFMYEGYKSKLFLENHTSSSIDLFQENYIEAKKIIEQVDPSQTKSLSTSLDSLQKDFISLVELLKQRGFKDYGLEGSLRKAIHSVENSGFEFDRISMLMLRRHEKDFFLRKDLKYQDEFNKRFDDFKREVVLNSGTELGAYLDNYKAQFNSIVEIEKRIGFSEAEGLRGDIQNYLKLIRPEIEMIRSSIKKENETQITSTQWVLWIIFSVQIIAGIAMAFFYSGLLTKSIKEIRGGMQKLASGVFPEKLSVISTEEIGQTKMAFNQFVDRLKAATTFAEQLGAGQLSSKYDDRYADDVLANSLINAQDKLRNAEEHQRKINWMNEGVAKFNDIIKNDDEDIVVLGDRILRLLVQYLDANQGALYIVSESTGDEFIERISTYAYEKKKYMEERLNLGTGLIGQCILEGETMYLKEIPREYVKITSGLGEATPRNVIIVPLKIRNRVMGVLELASFQLLEKHQVEFMERIAESVATILVNKQVASHTKQLLEESQQKAFALSQKEEEMRQNSEELSATQEEMERQRLDMQQEIKELKRKSSNTEFVDA